MHLDLQEEDEVFVLLPAHPRGSLCVRTCLCGCAYVYACRPRPPTTGERDWQPRIRRGANTRANKCTLVQSELHVLTQLCQQLCSETSPSWLADNQRTIKPKRNKITDVQQHFPPPPPTFWLPYMFRVFLIRCLMKLHVWRIHFSAYKPRESEPITVSSRSNRTGPALPSSLNSSCIQDGTHRSVMQRCSLHQQGRRLHSEKGWVKYCWQVILFI